MSRNKGGKTPPPSRPNEQARALFARAGTASVAIAVDTRPKVMKSRVLYNRKKAKRDLRDMTTRGSFHIWHPLPTHSPSCLAF